MILIYTRVLIHILDFFVISMPLLGEKKTENHPKGWVIMTGTMILNPPPPRYEIDCMITYRFFFSSLFTCRCAYRIQSFCYKHLQV